MNTLQGVRETRVIYLAAPMELRDVGRIEDASWTVGRRFPDAAIVDASTAFRSSAEWRERWPVTVRTIDGLVFLTAECGVIGAGVYLEILDAVFVGVPVWMLTPGDDFVPVALLDFRFRQKPTPRRFAVARVGEVG